MRYLITGLIADLTDEMIKEAVEEIANVDTVTRRGSTTAIVKLYEASESDAQRVIQELDRNRINNVTVRVDMHGSTGGGDRRRDYR